MHIHISPPRPPHTHTLTHELLTADQELVCECVCVGVGGYMYVHMPGQELDAWPPAKAERRMGHGAPGRGALGRGAPGPGWFTAQQVSVFSVVVLVLFPGGQGGGAGPVLPVTM